MGEQIIIEGRRITAPSSIGDDGLRLSDGKEYLVRDCIIDLSECDLDTIDEAASCTWGSSAIFQRCVIRGAGKLFLCGCGDADKVPIEEGKRVKFYDCILENFGRRGPEVQDGMHIFMQNCLIRNWGDSNRFTVRNFGAWAHSKGRIDAYGCVFWQDTFWRPIRQFIADICDHIGQAWNDEGLRGLIRPSTYIPGVCKGLFATAGGEAFAWQCWKNHWWIYLPWRHTTSMMDEVDAKIMILHLENMASELDAKLPR